ncbi:MAG TPA: thioredoxin domain-containing protein [Acidimicrobiales bacterium]|nr:thioredoxin domain-containing protein [Acidimicrobiales bacterium]
MTLVTSPAARTVAGVASVNRLARETSPYLLQHAANPVDWWPWGAAAFAEAHKRDVPVLISVGYSACHWCHVMAHESFEDAGVAAVLNSGFVPVKVDREERPDVDAVYMEAVQLLNGSGGWPMTVVATPDGRPFWAGTYLPKRQFLDLLAGVRDAWEHERTGLDSDAARLSAAVVQHARLPASSQGAVPGTGAGAGALARAAQGIVSGADARWGGSAGAPKFPQPATLEVLARHWWRSGDSAATASLRRQLDAMSSGGIYDHLGGGFARYSTDRRWLVPHFEKMLYDNALLVRAYTHAWQLSGDPRYHQVVHESVGYLLSPPLRLAAGAWASAEDADSEGEEGRFYTWDRREVEDVAGAAVADWYGVREQGNWEGRNILWRPDIGELARPPEIEAGRAALVTVRSQRPRPQLDAKVLTEWNAMAIAALAEAGRAFDEPGWVDEAATTAELLLSQLRRPDGRWLRSWRPDVPAAEPPALAYAGDYAWLVEAFTRLAEATGRSRWIEPARETAAAMTELFWDGAEGGFFTSGNDGEPLIARMKDILDGATPSANAVAANALARLAELTGDGDAREYAEAVLAALGPALDRAAAAFPAMALVADYLGSPRRQVVVASARPDVVQPVWARYLPDTVLAWGEPYPSPLWEGRSGPDAQGLAFVCEGFACRLPVPAEALTGALDQARPE